LEVYTNRPVESASALIDEKIKELGDWRGKTLAAMRGAVDVPGPALAITTRTAASAR
jgi:hypothetical protein